MSDSIGQAALAWWHGLQPRSETDEHGGKHAGKHTDKHTGRLGNPAALARLRRAASPVEALMVDAAHDLAKALNRGERDWVAIGTLAATLAHVRTHDPHPRMARLFGKQGGADTPVVSELRFRRLLQTEPGVERMAALRRALALTGGRANVADLADSLLFWNDRTRTRWLFEYYDAAPPKADPADLEADP